MSTTQVCPFAAPLPLPGNSDGPTCSHRQGHTTFSLTGHGKDEDFGEPQ